MAGANRMPIEEVVRKVLLDEHADVIREAVRAVAAEPMEVEVSWRDQTITHPRRSRRRWRNSKRPEPPTPAPTNGAPNSYTTSRDLTKTARRRT